MNKSGLKRLIKEILKEIRDTIPIDGSNYIIFGITDDNQNTISGITISGSYGHAHLKLIRPFDIQKQPLAYWRYRSKDNTLYIGHYTDQQIITIKNYLKTKYGIDNIKINTDVGWYVTTGHKVNEDHGLGYSHNVSFTDYQKERDPLNDPELTGKMNENYRFEDFNYMANFGDPSNVYYGTYYLGVIVSTPTGYIIDSVKGPRGETIKIKKSPTFKTKDDAALRLHHQWKIERNT